MSFEVRENSYNSYRITYAILLQFFKIKFICTKIAKKLNSTEQFDALCSLMVFLSTGTVNTFQCYKCSYHRLPSASVLNGDEKCITQMDQIENGTTECTNSSKCQVYVSELMICVVCRITSMLINP